MRRHIDNHCKENIKPKPSLVCLHCGKKFETNYKLDRHKKIHERETYVCSFCWREFSRLDHYQKHQLLCSTNSHNRSANTSFPSMVQHPNTLSTISFPDVSLLTPDYSPINCAVGSEVPVENDTFVVSDMDESVLSMGHSAFDSSNVQAFEDVSLNDTHGNSFGREEADSNIVTHKVDSDHPEVFILDDTYPDYDESPAKECDTNFEEEISLCTFLYLKDLKRKAARSTVKLQEYAKMCIALFEHRFEDNHFMELLADELGFMNKSKFLEFINVDRIVHTRRGRQLGNLTGRQLAYKFWVENSDLSNDRRNGRHVIKIKPEKLALQVSDLEKDPNITECNAKGGGKRLKAQKYIYSLTLNQLYEKFTKEHPEVKSSRSMFYRSKPFYIFPATPREMEGCLCQNCLNPHVLYQTLRKNMSHLPLSLSEYLATFISCQKDKDINFHTLECINGSCENQCTIINELGSSDVDWEKLVSYYQFEPVTEKFYDREGKEKFYKRVARTDYKDVKLKRVYELLMESSKSYLIHRYHTLSDKVYWNRYLGSVNQPIIWMDYSMNIKLTEKNQAQSAHYSGRQQTLHDSLIQQPDGSFFFIYHLSDDTNHDSVMTGKIIEDNLLKHPEVIENGRLILRSDNCSTQYKSRYVFKMLLVLAKRYGIRIDWMFGEAGHGRGLIDAMSWFGCKGPMRKYILEDKWFKNAEEMYQWLVKYFEGDTRKEYNLLDAEELAGIRKAGRDEREVPGCRASHVMSFFPDGETIKKWRTIKDFSELEDDAVDFQMEVVADDGEGKMEDDQEIEYDWIESIEIKDRFKEVKEQSFVAIKSVSGHTEMFHVMQVLEKRTANQHIKDSSEEHVVLNGEPYLIGQWYSFCHEGRKFATYKKSTNTENALIHMGEVILTDIQMKQKTNTEFQMSIEDYHMLVCSV